MAEARTRAAGRPAGLAVHATAVAIGAGGLLIRGASGAGKSALAFALTAVPTRNIRLVGDDRVLLRRDAAGAITVRPHPRIGGFIERRGLGLVAMPWQGRARLAGCVALGAVPAGSPAGCWLDGLPLLALDPLGRADHRAASDHQAFDLQAFDLQAFDHQPLAHRVLAWWDRLALQPSALATAAADRTQVA